MARWTQILALGLTALLAGLAGLWLGTRDPTPPANATAAPTLSPAPRSTARARQFEAALRGGQAIAAGPAEDAASAPDDGPDVPKLEAELQKLKGEKQRVEQQLADFLNWLLVNYKGRYPLPESFMAKLRLAPVTEEFTLHADVAQLLKISPEEENVINEAFRSTQVFLTDMEKALMTINEDQQDKVIVHIPAFGEEGQLVRDDLLLALEAILGAERFDRFMDVAESEMDNSFLKFGDRARTIIFQVVYSEDGSPPLLTIKDGFVEDLEDKRLITATQMTVPELPEAYVAYIDWLADYETSRAK